MEGEAREEPEEAQNREENKEESHTETKNEELDLCSSNFNPLKALESTEVKIPMPGAPLFDNVAVFIEKLKPSKSKGPGKRTTEREMRAKAEEVRLKRMEAFQMTESKNLTKQINVLTFMENVDGPLSLLKKIKEERLRIKVVTRNEKGVRGHCIGFLQAFDKNWNLAMTDVIEVWTRRKKKKVAAGIDDAFVEDEDVKLCKKIPKVTVKNFKKGVEECTRYIPQFMMRGEHVVLVNILNNP